MDKEKKTCDRKMVLNSAAARRQHKETTSWKMGSLKADAVRILCEISTKNNVKDCLGGSPMAQFALQK